MDQGVRHQLAHRRLRELREAPAQRRPDLLPRRQPGVDPSDQSLEAGGVPLRPLLLPERFEPARAPVLHDARRLALQPRKIVQVPGEQDGAQVRDVETARFARRHETFPPQRLQDRRVAVGQRRAEQMEVRRVVEPKQRLLAAQPLRRDAVLEARPVEPAPERALLFGVVLELPCRAADPDELDTLERHRTMRRGIDLLQGRAVAGVWALIGLLIGLWSGLRRFWTRFRPQAARIAALSRCRPLQPAI